MQDTKTDDDRYVADYPFAGMVQHDTAGQLAFLHRAGQDAKYDPFRLGNFLHKPRRKHMMHVQACTQVCDVLCIVTCCIGRRAVCDDGNCILWHAQG